MQLGAVAAALTTHQFRLDLMVGRVEEVYQSENSQVVVAYLVREIAVGLAHGEVIIQLD